MKEFTLPKIEVCSIIHILLTGTIKKKGPENSVLKNMNIDVRVLGYKELLLNLIQARDSFITSAFFRLYFCKEVYVLLLFLLKAIPLVK